MFAWMYYTWYMCLTDRHTFFYYYCCTLSVKPTNRPVHPLFLPCARTPTLVRVSTHPSLPEPLTSPRAVRHKYKYDTHPLPPSLPPLRIDAARSLRTSPPQRRVCEPLSPRHLPILYLKSRHYTRPPICIHPSSPPAHPSPRIPARIYYIYKRSYHHPLRFPLYSYFFCVLPLPKLRKTTSIRS